MLGDLLRALFGNWCGTSLLSGIDSSRLDRGGQLDGEDDRFTVICIIRLHRRDRC